MCVLSYRQIIITVSNQPDSVAFQYETNVEQTNVNFFVFFLFRWWNKIRRRIKRKMHDNEYSFLFSIFHVLFHFLRFLCFFFCVCRLKCSQTIISKTVASIMLFRKIKRKEKKIQQFSSQEIEIKMFQEKIMIQKEFFFSLMIRSFDTKIYSFFSSWSTCCSYLLKKVFFFLLLEN